ncbi:hypothetical protein ABT56_18315 [Photobacterium aquae]|uniref:Uncharacterized protein n=1 Tax=Photobacterium aquae TaxID=1195763 RepID=A0A0J1GW44_9GAMM|nr:hypothetical protein [Photobacterium aquae]KLV03654.1 hypothetical protein ABT56_18315 [Photobacterium aquae]
MMLNQMFNEELYNATQELCVIDPKGAVVSDVIGRFAAKQLFSEDIARSVDEDGLISIYLLKQQVIHAKSFLEAVSEVDVTNTISADTVAKMDFETKNYATIYALHFAIQKQEEGGDPFDDLTFMHLAPTCDDLNRLVSSNENKLSQVLTEEDFAAFDNDFSAMLRWASDPARRFTQVPSSGRYPVTDSTIIYDLADLSDTKGPLLPELEKRLVLRCQALLNRNLKELLGDSLTLERYCNDRSNIYSLSHSLKLDKTAFSQWFEKALSEQFRNTNKVLSGLKTNTTSEDKRIYREDVINLIANKDIPIVTHPIYKSTSKLVPFICINTELVIAVEMTKFGSIFMPRHHADKDLLTELPYGMCKLYEPVTTETVPYGRNSHLRQINELAWCELLKVKIRTKEELDKVISLISA